jgi:hypothetical protein
VKRRTAADRNRGVESRRPREEPIAIETAGAEDADAEIMAFLDGLLAEGRAVVRSRGAA